MHSELGTDVHESWGQVSVPSDRTWQKTLPGTNGEMTNCRRAVLVLQATLQPFPKVRQSAVFLLST